MTFSLIPVKYILLRRRAEQKEDSALAQLVERLTVNQDVVSSSLTGGVSGKWLSLVEHLVWDQGVAGSNPVFPICGSSSVVEHHLAMVGVAGSNPVFRFSSNAKELNTICTHSATG